jgi:hypothetical protein
MHPVMLRGSKKSRMCMKVPSTTTLSFPTLSPLLTAGKIQSDTFLTDHVEREEETNGMQKKCYLYDDRLHAQYNE